MEPHRKKYPYLHPPPNLSERFSMAPDRLSEAPDRHSEASDRLSVASACLSEVSDYQSEAADSLSDRILEVSGGSQMGDGQGLRAVRQALRSPKRPDGAQGTAHSAYATVSFKVLTVISFLPFILMMSL